MEGNEELRLPPAESSGETGEARHAPLLAWSTAPGTRSASARPAPERTLLVLWRSTAATPPLHVELDARTGGSATKAADAAAIISLVKAAAVVLRALVNDLPRSPIAHGETTCTHEPTGRTKDAGACGTDDCPNEEVPALHFALTQYHSIAICESAGTVRRTEAGISTGGALRAAGGGPITTLS